jgi:hypothetical protein
MSTSGAEIATPVRPVVALKPRVRTSCISKYNIVVLFERTPTEIAGPSSHSNHRNQYLMIAMDYFTKWAEAYASPNKEALVVAETLVTIFFCPFRAQ